MIGGQLMQTPLLAPARMLMRVLLAIWMALPCVTAAAEDNSIAAAEKQLQAIKTQLSETASAINDFEVMAKDIDGIRRLAVQCIEHAEQDSAKLAEDLKTLGSPVAGEDASVTRARHELNKNRGVIEKRLTVCRLLRVNGDELEATVAEHQNRIFKQQILARDRTFTDLMKGDWGKISEWLAAVKSFVVDTRGLEQVGGMQWVLLGSLVLLGAALGQVSKRRLLAVLPQPTDKDDLIFLAMVAFGATLAHYLPLLLPLAVASGTLLVLLLGVEPLPNVLLLGLGLTFYVLALVLVRGLFKPPAPASLYLPVPESVCRALAHRLYVLASLLLIGFLIFSTILVQQLPEAALLLTRTVFITVLVINLGWVLWLVGELPVWRHTAPVRVLIILALFAGLMAEWAGYRNLSGLIIGGLVSTLLLFAIIFLLGRVMRRTL